MVSAENIENSESLRQLECITIRELLERKYNFFIPDYQRGYRWGEKEVLTLLRDLRGFCENHESGFYCLQPITLKKMTQKEIIEKKLEQTINEKKEWFEVVDGQQRLTTIYILMLCAYELVIPLMLRKPLYEIYYETRVKSADFLKNLNKQTEESALENIDFNFIFKAYTCIKTWFCEQLRSGGDERNPAIMVSDLLCGGRQGPDVKVILYLADEHMRSETLFDNLNAGKILLSNSELIKALFLSNGSMSKVKDGNCNIISADEQYACQHHIALQWDIMEKSFSDRDFWSFITDKKLEDYDTKIDVLFETIYEGKDTFSAVERALEGSDTWTLWLQIERYYNILLEWYKDNNLYHFIGYVVARNSEGKLRELLLESEKLSRKEFLNKILKEIQAKLPKNWEDTQNLSYDKNYEQIIDLLLFYNIEVTRKQHEQRFPFYHYKHQKYSLEHIHAQNADKFDENKKEPLQQFLEDHIDFLKQKYKLLESRNDIDSQMEDLNSLIETCERFKENFANVSGKDLRDTIDKVLFVLSNLSVETDTSQKKDELSNMALLDQSHNSFLSASAFAYKRNKIMELDQKGDFIPVCTRRVFMKYYAKPANANDYSNQIYYWSKNDREAYLQDIENEVSHYIDMPLQEQ